MKGAEVFRAASTESDGASSRAMTDGTVPLNVDPTRLTPGDVAILHALLAGRVGEEGTRAVAAEIGTTPHTLRRALRRATMRPATVDRLRAALAARANDGPPRFLTNAEAGELATLTRIHGSAKLARRLGITISTMIRARSGSRLQRATVARIRDRLGACMMHADCFMHPTLGRSCRASTRAAERDRGRETECTK